MRKLFLVILLLPFTWSNAQQKTLDIKSIRSNIVNTETIPLDFIDTAGNLNLQYVNGIKFAYLDSIDFEDRHPDKLRLYTTYQNLDFTKPIDIYSPEYYSLSTAYYTNRAMMQYNELFGGKIDFNSQEDYRNIEIVIGDMTEITTPRQYIFRKGLDISPSIYYHEVGHRAFWYLEKGLNIKFKGLSLIHMGLLEYLTMSLNNSHLVGENCLPKGAIRNGELQYSYQHTDTLTLGSLMNILRTEYAEEIKDPKSSYYRDMDAFEYTFGNRLDKVIDNHKGGMILASTLWRIRQQLGTDITNRLVANTILSLNSYMERRASFYKAAPFEKLNPEKIEWIDVYIGLIKNDALLNSGNGKDIIYKEFKKTEYPVDGVI